MIRKDIPATRCSRLKEQLDSYTLVLAFELRAFFMVGRMSIRNRLRPPPPG